MKWTCFFNHDWKEQSCDSSRSFRIGWIYETVILFKCKKCSKYKTQTVKGSWKNQDDDDDDDSSPHKPIPSPDDYYDMVEKQ